MIAPPTVPAVACEVEVVGAGEETEFVPEKVEVGDVALVDDPELVEVATGVGSAVVVGVVAAAVVPEDVAPEDAEPDDELPPLDAAVPPLLAALPDDEA